MTPHENKALMALDRLVEANPRILTHGQISLYRDLLIKYIGLVSYAPAQAGDTAGRHARVEHRGPFPL